jgi:cytosine-specific methyltransferase
MIEDAGNPKSKLVGYYSRALKEKYLVQDDIKVDMELILDRVNKNKGVYTVLVTLALYKTLHPEQDIRQHKINLPNGFSGRSFDTKYVTPVLKDLSLPSMAESGWLTRSLEQDYSFDMNFNGMITPVELKNSFLRVVAKIQESDNEAEKVLLALLHGGIEYRENNKIEIARVDTDDIRIETVVDMLKDHFTTKYNTHGGSKLPVLAFYTIYSIIVPEMGRYKDCHLLKLGSHTASDRTSKSAGDIEVARRDNSIFEAVEVKLDKPVTPQIVQVAYEKINKFGVERYYILSGVEQKIEDIDRNSQLTFEIQQEHGCQLIINGLYSSLKYYLRLIANPKDFLDKYTELVEKDTELQPTHKERLQKLIDKYFG